jgi:hypothetical protein
MAPDQRYCLSCGNRRGDPRLPFMDAVVFMDAVKRPAAAAPPPPPRESRPRLSANASLIAGVATLVLAIGVGVLIGRSGDQTSTPANTTPQVITVEGGGTGTGTTEATPGSAQANAAGGDEKAGKGAAQSKAEAGSSGTSKAAEEVLKPEGDVKLPPPKAQVGESCDKQTAGCSKSGEFDGSFFE